MTESRVRALSFHARYACAHAGACCSAGWPIPVETTVLPLLQAGLDTGRLQRAAEGDPWTVPVDRPPTIGAVLGRSASGPCVFFDRAQEDGCCRVHRHLGTRALPIACQQFPRIVRRDARGTDISLSHWCPTALACLDHPGPATIVDLTDHALPAFAHEGLDAREAWPPMLRPACLWTLEAFDLFEHQAVDLLANAPGPIDARVVALVTWADHLRRWTPADGTLEAYVRASRPAVGDASSQARLSTPVQEHLWQALVEAVPDEWRSAIPIRMTSGPADVAVHDDSGMCARVGRYLAGRLFASWVAYQGTGVRALAASIATAWVAVQRGLAGAGDAPTPEAVGDAIRAADLVLVHLASPDALAGQYDRWERARGVSVAGLVAGGP